MFSDLNDDCLENIFKRLDLNDQLIMKSFSRRFEEVIESIWRQKCKKVVIDRNQMRKFRESKRNHDLVAYLAYISGSVKDLRIDNIYEDQFRMLEPIRFPKVSTLDIGLWTEEDGRNDEDTLLLHKMFPAVVDLTFQSSITGKYLWQFTNVKDLNIDCCEYLDQNYFARIFGTLKLRRLSIMFYGYNTNFEEPIKNITLCKTLEELRLDDHHLLHFIDDVKDMPKLRRITFYSRDYDDYLMERIANLYGTLMRKMIYHDAFWSKTEHLESLLKMKNLENLIIIDDDLDDDQIEEVANNLTKLREFRFIKSRLKNVDNGILSVVENCPALEILDVSQTKVSEEFLQRLNCVVEKQHKRNVPLKFYCFDTVVAKDFSNEMPLSKQLCVSVVEQHLDLPASRSFDCIWEPISDDTSNELK